MLVYYEIKDEAAEWFGELLGAFDRIAASWVWRIASQGDTQTAHQRKINAGASTIVSRSRIRANVRGPRLFTTNLPIPTLSSGRESLHFLPDRLLVEHSGRFVDVPYSGLSVHFGPQRLIEDGAIPPHSTRVDTTWRFVKVDGGPDLRFNNNRQLPVMLYGRIELRSDPAAGHDAVCRWVRSTRCRCLPRVRC